MNIQKVPADRAASHWVQLGFGASTIGNGTNSGVPEKNLGLRFAGIGLIYINNI